MPPLLLGPPISEPDVELALEELEPQPRGTYPPFIAIVSIEQLVNEKCYLFLLYCSQNQPINKSIKRLEIAGHFYFYFYFIFFAIGWRGGLAACE